MNAATWAERLLVTSLEATLLALVLGALVFLIGRRLPARLRYGLWLLVMARLLLPAPLPDPTGLRPALRFGEGAGAAVEVGQPGPAAMLGRVGHPDQAQGALGGAASAETGPVLAAASPAPVPEPAWREPGERSGDGAGPFWTIILALWAAGAVVLMAVERRRWSRMRRGLRSVRPVDDPALLAQVEAIRSAWRMRRSPRLLETPLVASPAVCGLRRPLLLLPVGAFARLDPEERRLVLRHELAHLRRGDLQVNSLLLLLRCLHWFNPLIWWASARLRDAQALARDADALAAEPPASARRYAATLLTLVPPAGGDRLLPLAALLPRHSDLKRRLVMIMNTRAPRRGSAAAGSLLLLALGWASLFAAPPPQDPGVGGEEPRSAGVPILAGVPLIGDLFGGETLQQPGKQSERALDAALAWLCAQQTEAGYWDCGGKPAAAAEGDAAPAQPSPYGNPVNDVGVTGLALLSLLGSDRAAEGDLRQQAVARAIGWLRSVQRDDGLLGEDVGNTTLYNHGIAAFALAEALYLSPRDGDLRETVEAAVGLILRARNGYTVWRYSLVPNGDNDSSVSSWMVLALSSAADSGVKVPSAVLRDASDWFETLTDSQGRCGYSIDQGAGSRPSRPRTRIEDFPPELTESLTAAALFCQVVMTDTTEVKQWNDHPKYGVMSKHAALIAGCPPRWTEDGSTCDFYYWYMGTMAAYQWGGDPWETWRQALQPTLVEHQRMAEDAGALRGSWDPVGPWGQEGGRVYSTALATLALECVHRDGRMLGAR